MATPRKQRIGILIILIVTVIGTLGSFLVLVLNSQNQQKDQVAYQEAYTKYQADMSAYQKKIDAQTAQLSAQYYPEFSQYESTPAKFDLNSITKLVSTDLKVGEGATIDDTTNFAAYYIGWDPDGTIFDQSIASNALKAPLAVNGLANASLIQGWKDGIKGMKIGGIRELDIPSDQAYGEQGSKDSSGKTIIGPNTPLKFILMAIPAPATIPQPTVPAILMQGVSQ